MLKNRRYKPHHQRTTYLYDPGANGAFAYLKCPHAPREQFLPSLQLELEQRRALMRLLEQWRQQADELGLPTEVLEHMLAQNRFRHDELAETLFLLKFAVEE